MNMTSLKWKDIVVRTFWTFAQAFLAFIIADMANALNTDTLKKATIAGIASSLALIKTIASQLSSARNMETAE